MKSPKIKVKLMIIKNFKKLDKLNHQYNHIIEKIKRIIYLHYHKVLKINFKKTIVIKKMTYKIFSKNLKNKKNKLVTYQSVVLIADLY